MDQVKIGKFIAQCRKDKNMTQAQLAEKLNITDRAISKWETGKGMPDSGVMLDLCNELVITVYELLSGEMIEMNNYDRKAEENLLKLNEGNEHKRKLLLKSGVVIILLVFIIILIELNGFVRQVAKSNLDDIISDAESTLEIYVKIENLEKRITELEKTVDNKQNK